MASVNAGRCRCRRLQGKFDATQYSFFGEPDAAGGGLLDEALEVRRRRAPRAVRSPPAWSPQRAAARPAPPPCCACNNSPCSR
jgi:hypothetical protein